MGEIVFLSLRLSSSVTSAAFWNGVWVGVGSRSAPFSRVLPSAASHRTRHHSQESEHVSVLRSERPSGFLVAGVQCFGVEMIAHLRAPAQG